VLTRTGRYTLSFFVQSGIIGLLLRGDRPYAVIDDKLVGNVTSTLLEPMGAGCTRCRLHGPLGGDSRLAADKTARHKCRRLYAMDGD
jgi:hypothetical protein